MVQANLLRPLSDAYPRVPFRISARSGKLVPVPVCILLQLAGMLTSLTPSTHNALPNPVLCGSRELVGEHPTIIVTNREVLDLPVSDDVRFMFRQLSISHPVFGLSLLLTKFPQK